jgi:glutathione S-transferase
VRVEPGKSLDEKSRKKVDEGYAALEQMLADGRQFQGGSAPDLSDLAVWPFLWKLETAGLHLPGARAAAYWQRARERESLTFTSPSAVRAR